MQKHCFSFVGPDFLVPNLIRVSHSSHAAHDTQNIVIDSVHTDLGGVGSGNGSGGKHELHHCIINAREVARPAGLVFLGAQSKGVHVDTAVRSTGVVLEGLNGVKVRTLTLREAVLSVELQLGSDNGVLTPAVHVKGSLSKHEGAGIGERGSVGGTGGSVADLYTTQLEQTRRVNDGTSPDGGIGRTECNHGIRKSINGISVVEGLGTKGLEQSGIVNKGSTVVNVGIGLNDPDKLLARVVEVQLDLVGRGTDRLVTSELHLLNEVFVGVLCHLAALIGIEEDVVNVQRGSNKGLLVSLLHGRGGTGSGTREVANSPQALTNGAEINVDLHLVVLKGNQGKGKSGVTAKPELQRHVKGGLRQGVAGSAHLVGGRGGSARTRHTGEVGVGDVGKLGGVTNHLEVTSLLLLGEGQLVPDVHPVTILTVNALTTNLNLNLGNQLLTDEI